jgi:hypothetical protein
MREPMPIQVYEAIGAADAWVVRDDQEAEWLVPGKPRRLQWAARQLLPIGGVLRGTRLALIDEIVLLSEFKRDA